MIDNGSSDGSPELLEKDPRITLLKSATNLGFAGACNLGIASSRSQYVVLANSDLLFTPRWLSRLISAIELNDRIGLVGPITNMAAGFQKEILKKYTSDEGLIANSEMTNRANRGFLLEVPFLIFFCVLIKRSVIDLIGELDASFGLGGCDDFDFCLRSNNAGFACAIDRSTFVHHTCSQTYASNHMDYNKLLLEARDGFIKKWGLRPPFP